MALLRAFQPALNKVSSNYGILLIFQWAFVLCVLLPVLFVGGLIGAGCVIFWVIILAPVVIFFSPILVPFGIFVGWVTSVTLATAGVIVWRWKDIVRVGQGAVEAAKRLYFKVVQWLLTEIENMDATYESEPTVPATPPKPQTPHAQPETPSADSTPSENSPEKSEQNKSESSSSQTPEKSYAENSLTDESFHSIQQSHAGDGAKEKSLLFKSFLCICAGIAIAQCVVHVFFSFLATNMEQYASGVLETARR